MEVSAVLGADKGGLEMENRYEKRRDAELSTDCLVPGLGTSKT